MPVIRFTVTVLWGIMNRALAKWEATWIISIRLKRKGNFLLSLIRFSHSPNNSEANTDYEDTLNVPYLLQNQYFKNDASTQEHTAQLDYTNPINSIHSIETGIKYIFVE